MKTKIEIQNRISALELNEKRFLQEIKGSENLEDIDSVLITINRTKIQMLKWVLGGEE